MKKSYERPTLSVGGSLQSRTKGGNDGFGFDGVEWWKPLRNASNDYF